MNKETYEKLNSKYLDDKAEIIRCLQSLSLGSSNLEENIQKALFFSSKLNTVWDYSGVKNKELLQKFIFPDGIIYDTKKEAVLTPKANPFFEQIASLQRVLENSNNDKGSNNAAFVLFCRDDKMILMLVISWFSILKNFDFSLVTEFVYKPNQFNLI